MIALGTGASPPLVFGGILVGLLLLVLFLGILLRTFRSMQAASERPGYEIAHQAATELSDRWYQTFGRDNLRALIDELRLSEDPGEAVIFATALSDITSRYFATDGIAWEVWFRRESESFCAHASGEAQPMPAGEYLRVS